MCSQPEILLESFAKDGADQLTIRTELTDQARDLIWRIRNLERKVGLAVNPPTPLAAAEPYLDKIDTLLIMTVNHGFGGQSFMEECLPKIQQAWQYARNGDLDSALRLMAASMPRQPLNAPAWEPTLSWVAPPCSINAT